MMFKLERADLLGVGLATAGTTLAFVAADKFGALPGFFQTRSEDESQQRKNSFIAGAITAGVVTSIFLYAWRSR